MMISISNLPGDLESEILSRVPATFLAQLQFTCKRWYALFKDPKFIKKNLGKTAAAMQMVLKKDQSVYSFSMDFSGIHNRYDQFIQFTGKLRSLKDSEDVKISEISHCEGLLLCKTKDQRLVVWNPCTGQTRLIQWRVSSNLYPMRHKYFLGYENKDKDSYKILSLSRYQNGPKATVEMYELNSDSWRVLDDVTKTFCGEHGVSLKGNTYWLDSVTEEGTLVNFILRFDFSRERFGRLPLPFDADDEDDLVAVLSVFREEKLAVLYQMVESYTMKIWMTNDIKTDDLSWSEFLVVDFEKLVRNGMTRVMSFLVDEETKKVMCCDTDGEDGDRTRIYIVGEDIHKQVYREMAKGQDKYNPLLLSYVPSLVQIPARQSNPGDKGKRHGQEAIALTKSK